MKISAAILSFCGFCVLYICNADWIDELIETYLGSDYEEVAPFISSVTAGTEEFDRLVEELRQSRQKRWFRSPFGFLYLFGACTFSVLLYRRASLSWDARGLVEAGIRLLTGFRNSDKNNREEIQNLVAEFLEKKLKQFCRGQSGDDVPVKLLWKGGTLVESSMHCGIREGGKIPRVQKQLKSLEGGGGDERVELATSTSEESTAQKMANIRKLLESEQEIHRTETVERTRGYRGEILEGSRRPKKMSEWTAREEQDRSEDPDACTADEESGVPPDPKLMNRIRLLESRLRLEELKNKNWISRMSRAEGILQQLNKQVERIEETRPVETLTETLRITSTVTNWASHPRRNLQFTLVDRHPLFHLRTPYTSLSELIQREVGLPSSIEHKKNPYHLPPAPQIPALPSPTIMPQSTFLSKFLCR